ncbi:MAG: glycerol-3-phosphate 1-O-acyltransferase PlsY [Anaeroplasmataceae bacterium]
MILTSLALNITLSIAFLLLSYVIGSMPFGLWIGKAITGIDVREHGSKNIGTTNCIRVLGKKVGFLVFFFDVLKGMFVIILVRYILENFTSFDSKIPYLFYGLSAIIGHTFSIFLKFKGGKGVATSLGVVFILCPLAAINCLIVFGIVLLLTGYVCLCSSAAAIAVVTTGWLLYAFGPDNNFIIGNPGLDVCILFSIVATFLIYKHKSNFKRLINGTENCFKKKKSKPAQEETKKDDCE